MPLIHMKRFVFKIVVFFIIIAAIDFLIGKICNYMIYNSAGGGGIKRLLMFVNVRSMIY